MEVLITYWSENFLDPQRIPVALLAILLVGIVGAITGPINGNANACIWGVVDGLLGRIGDKLDKTHRMASDLFLRGFIVSVTTIFLLAIWAKSTQDIMAQNTVWSFGLSVVLVSLFLSAGAVSRTVLRVYSNLSKTNKEAGKETTKGKKGAYFELARSMRANLNKSDDYGIVRIAINYLARSFDKNMVAPVFWFIVIGFPGLFVYAGVAALAWRFGKEGTSKGFGQPMVTFEKLMGFVPSAFAGCLIAVASIFTPTAKTYQGMIGVMGSLFKAPQSSFYNHGGLPVIAMAWSLGLSLGGPYQDVNGDAIKAPWVGPKNATSKNDYQHLRRALYIYGVAHILWIMSLLGAYLWSVVIFG